MKRYREGRNRHTLSEEKIEKLKESVYNIILEQRRCVKYSSTEEQRKAMLKKKFCGLLLHNSLRRAWENWTDFVITQKQEMGKSSQALAKYMSEYQKQHT